MLLMLGLITAFIACKKSDSPAPAPAPDPVPPPAASSDRKITMTVDNMTPVAGTNVTFTLVAENIGPAATTGISVCDILPTGYTLVSTTPSTGSYTASAWGGFGLTKGASATLTIVVKVNATGIYVNTAMITGVENDPVTGNNTATVTPTPTVPKVLMVSTLAGGTQGYLDGTGAAAQFSSPRGVGTDAAGNVYVVDPSNNRIRKITPAGVVTTLAGSTDGYADGMGATAKFSGPNTLAVDAAGNVCVADIGSDRIRKITPGGIVSTVAGGPTMGYTDGPVATALFQYPYAIAVDAAGNLYVADVENNVIRKIGY